jgi:MFS transporter, ACS family, tartrate transporter
MLKKDLDITELQYSWSASIFYATYMLFEVPSNIAMEQVGARKWMARIAVTWGTISVCMMFVRDFAGLMCIRLALGLAEAGFFPGAVLYLTYFYTPRERSAKIAILYVAQVFAGILGGVLSYPLLKLEGVGGLHGWQWLFMTEGLPAVVIGVVAYFALPSDPSDASWLNPAGTSPAELGPVD